MVMSVPEFRKFRKAVDIIDSTRNKTLIMLLYLTAARVSEIITKTSPWEIVNHQTKSLGGNLSIELLKERGSKKPGILLITIPISKKLGKLKNYRVVALPGKLEYEPWLLYLLRYRANNHKKLSFVLTRQRVGQIVKKELGLLDSSVSPDKLRAYRITHLVKEYGFDQIDLMAYLGIPMKPIREVADLNLPDISPDLSWKRYFPKLLKPFFQNREY
jgi:integrase